MAITVPTVGAEISVTEFGKPVADAVNLHDKFFTPTWTNFAFGTNFEQYPGNAVCGYFQVGKLVTLRGTARNKNSLPGADYDIVIIPTAIKPQSFNGIAPCSLGSAIVYLGGASGNLMIALQGATMNAGGWIALDGISWYIP